MNQNNVSNHHHSSGQPDSDLMQEGASREKENLYGPHSVVIDLSEAIRDFGKSVKYVRVKIDPADVLKHLANEITSKDYDKDAVFDFISDVRFNNEEHLSPNEIACIADAIEKLGMALVNRLRQHNIYNPETGRFEYWLYGFSTDSMAVFRTLMRRE